MKTTELVIIGAGPIGLEAASLAAQKGLDFLVLERDEVAHHVAQWGHIRLFTPFHMNHSGWSEKLFARESPEWALPNPDSFLTGAEYRKNYLLPLARLHPLKRRIASGVEVLEIGKEGLGKHDQIGQASRWEKDFLLRVRSSGQESLLRSRFVIDASGVYSNPLPFGVGNLSLPDQERFSHKIIQQIPSFLGPPETVLGRSLVLVGSGFSAASVLEQAEKLNRSGHSLEIDWVYRSCQAEPYPLIREDPLPYRKSLGRMANQLATNSPPWLRVHAGAAIVSLSEATADRISVGIKKAEFRQTLVADQIISTVGFTPDRRLYERLQVHECYASLGPIKLAASLLGGSGDCLEQPSAGIELLRNPEAGFYIIGNKSYGSLSSFLLKNGLDQIEHVINDIQEMARANSLSRKEHS